MSILIQNGKSAGILLTRFQLHLHDKETTMEWWSHNSFLTAKIFLVFLWKKNFLNNHSLWHKRIELLIKESPLNKTAFPKGERTGLLCGWGRWRPLLLPGQQVAQPPHLSGPQPLELPALVGQQLPHLISFRKVLVKGHYPPHLLPWLPLCLFPPPPPCQFTGGLNALKEIELNYVSLWKTGIIIGPPATASVILIQILLKCI